MWKKVVIWIGGLLFVGIVGGWILEEFVLDPKIEKYETEIARLKEREQSLAQDLAASREQLDTANQLADASLQRVKDDLAELEEKSALSEKRVAALKLQNAILAERIKETSEGPLVPIVEDEEGEALAASIEGSILRLGERFATASFAFMNLDSFVANQAAAQGVLASFETLDLTRQENTNLEALVSEMKQIQSDEHQALAGTKAALGDCTSARTKCSQALRIAGDLIGAKDERIDTYDQYVKALRRRARFKKIKEWAIRIGVGAGAYALGDAGN